MKTLCTIVLAIAIGFSYAQNSLRPQEQIDALQKSKMVFSKHALFTAKHKLEDPVFPHAAAMILHGSAALHLIKYAYPAIEINIPVEQEVFTLELFRIDLQTQDFSVKLADPTDYTTERSEGVFYRGVVKGKAGSLVSLSIFQDEVMGMISIPGIGNLTLAKYKTINGENSELHVLYNEDLIPGHHDFQCFTPDQEKGYTAQELESVPELRSANNCINLYLEVDYDVYLDKGGVDGATRYIQAVFNEAATLYANEQIKLNLSHLYIWNTTSPYSAYDAYGLLSQFKDKRAGLIKGDAGMLLSYKGGGGIAVVDGLCDPFNLGFAGIGKNYATVPSYSFTVMVLAHELGHILGSQHTHSCVWNGNNTAIDGCPGFTDGGCSTPPVPIQGGTIMSYCHISPYGINFALGFGLQPGNIIRNRIANATCLSACQSTPVFKQPSCGEIVLNIILDAYGNEITWEVVDATNAVVDRGGPYSIQSNGVKIQKKMCLPAGCYTLRVLDSRGDGLCCRYGNGSFVLTDNASTILAEGGQFTREASTAFCIDQYGKKVTPTSPPPTTNLGCTEINFNNYKVETFGESQDQGTATIGDNGKSIVLRNNAWKAIPLEYELTTNSYLELEFRSTEAGEIHAIGLDNDQSISTIYTFQLWGSQPWGYQDFNNYDGSGAWKKYTIPIGQKYTGKAKYLFFACDNDAVATVGNSQFRNVRLYEKNPCPRLSNFETPEDFASALKVYPNPAQDQVHFNFQDWPQGKYSLIMADLMGKVVGQQQVVKAPGDATINYSVAHLPEGLYSYTIIGESQEISGKIIVARAR